MGKRAQKGDRLSLRDDRALSELIGSVGDAFRTPASWWLPSLIGRPRSWCPARYSEYELLWSGNVRRLVHWLVDVSVPSIPGRAPRWVPAPIGNLFWHHSHTARHPDEDGRFHTFSNEAWFFINGILTDAALAWLNGDYLADLFHRPVTMIENATDGAFVDLLECAVERLGATAEDVDAAFPPLIEALKDPRKERIVVITHSQGTLIIAVVLDLIKEIYGLTDETTGDLASHHIDAIHSRTRAEGMRFDRSHIKPITKAELRRLEVYCFANCASHMCYFDRNEKIPWIESFGNEHDVVARLGVLAPHPSERDITIDGPRWEHRGAWGHLLNIHYLRAIDKAQPPGLSVRDSKPYVLAKDSPGAEVPRLYRYLR
jgi:hypothetical protein